MSQHTPGPWTAVRTKYRTLINCHDGSPVAQCESLTDADMALVAAAPELLDALRGLFAAVVSFTNATEEDWPELSAAAAAIDKATGSV